MSILTRSASAASSFVCAPPSFDDTAPPWSGRPVTPGSGVRRFGKNGLSVVDLGNVDTFAPFWSQPPLDAKYGAPVFETADGKLLVLVARIASGADGGPLKTRLFRLDAAGDLDRTFGDGGSVDFDEELQCVYELPSKKIVLGCSRDVSGGTLHTRRLLPDGTNDATFGDDGLLVLDETLFDLPPGTLRGGLSMFQGKAGVRYAFVNDVDPTLRRIYRFDDERGLDRTFNDGKGFFTVPYDMAFADDVYVADDKVYIVHGTRSAEEEPGLALTRYDANGVDASFGDEGAAFLTERTSRHFQIHPLAGGGIGVTFGVNRIVAFDSKGRVDTSIWEQGFGTYRGDFHCIEPHTNAILSWTKRLDSDRAGAAARHDNWSVQRRSPNGAPDKLFVTTRGRKGGIQYLAVGREAVYAVAVRIGTRGEEPAESTHLLEVTKLAR